MARKASLADTAPLSKQIKKEKIDSEDTSMSVILDSAKVAEATKNLAKIPKKPKMVEKDEEMDSMEFKVYYDSLGSNLIRQFQSTSLDEAEKEVVGHLLHLADGKIEKEFQGFAEEEAAEMLQNDLEAEVEMNQLEPSVPTVSTAAPLCEGDARLIVSQVIEELTPIIKSVCVTERMLQIQVLAILKKKYSALIKSLE